MISREHLSINLRTYGEDQCAESVLALSDEQMDQIGLAAVKYAVTGMLLAKATSLAALEVIEGRPRDLKRKNRRLKGIYPGY